MRKNYPLFFFARLLTVFLALIVLTHCNNRSGLLESDYAPSVTATNPGEDEDSVSISTPISATFSDEMDPSSITTETFLLRRNGDIVSGTVTYSDETAVFRTNNPLRYGQQYSATITTGAENLDGVGLNEDHNWTFTTQNEPTEADTVSPQVFSTNPPDGDEGVSINSTVIANFDEPLNQETVTGSSFIISRSDGSTVDGTVSYANNTAVFEPDSELSYTTQYTAVVTTDIEDRSGNSLEEDYSWSFTTGDEPDEGETDETPPEISSTNPEDNADDISVNASVTADFSERMNPSTINSSSFTLELNGTPISGSVSYAGRQATFSPNSELDYGETYEATITSDVTDESGNNLSADYEWNFTTEDEPDQGNSDEIPPEIEAVNPENGAGNVNVNTNITADFNEPMDGSTINESSFLVEQNGSSVSGSVSYAGERATFNPDDDLDYEQEFTVTVTEAVTDQAGNNMESDFSWDFTTREEPDNDPPSITSYDPDIGDTDVPVTTTVSVQFSEPMDGSSINEDSFLLFEDGEPLSGSVEYSGQTATFTPDDDLAYETTFTAELTSDVEDQNGNSLTGTTEWNFTTEEETDNEPPSVVASDPQDGEDDVPVSTTVSADFSEPMESSSINENSFRLSQGGETVSGSVSYANQTATFEPDENLEYLTSYSAALTTEIEDENGNSLSGPMEWSFTTEADPTPLTVLSTQPENDEDDVAIDAEIVVLFSEEINPESINESTFEVLRDESGPGPPSVEGERSTDGDSVTFTPDSDLEEDTEYLVVLTAEIESMEGRQLGEEYSWGFETDDD